MARRRKRGRRDPVAMHARLLAAQRDEDLEERADRNTLRAASHEELLLEWLCDLAAGNGDARPHRSLTDRVRALAEDLKPGNLELGQCGDLLRLLRQCAVIQSGTAPPGQACAACGHPAAVWMKFASLPAGVQIHEAKWSDRVRLSWGCAQRALVYHQLYHLDEIVAEHVRAFVAQSELDARRIADSPWYHTLCGLYTDPRTVVEFVDTKDGWTRTCHVVADLRGRIALTDEMLGPAAHAEEEEEPPTDEDGCAVRAPRGRRVRLLDDDDDNDHDDGNDGNAPG